MHTDFSSSLHISRHVTIIIINIWSLLTENSSVKNMCKSSKRNAPSKLITTGANNIYQFRDNPKLFIQHIHYLQHLQGPEQKHLHPPSPSLDIFQNDLNVLIRMSWC